MKGSPHGLTRREKAVLASVVAALVLAPLVASNYIVSVLTISLYYAYVGQAWNIMFGFAGLLSLGHALFIGLGAYASAALFVHFGIGPWAGIFLAVPSAVAVGSERATTTLPRK